MMKESYDQQWDNRARPAAESTSIPVERPKEVVVDAERNDALEGQKAGEAVFKAIFGDDSDDE